MPRYFTTQATALDSGKTTRYDEEAYLVVTLFGISPFAQNKTSPKRAKYWVNNRYAKLERRLTATKF